MAVMRILTNPAYKGAYRYRHSEHEQVFIPVPAIVDETTWQAAQTQLWENRRYSRRNNQKHQYLLRSLIRCHRCGGGYTGFAKGKYRGYRCSRNNWTVSSTGQRCTPGSIPAKPVEEAVWKAVKEAHQNPQLLIKEYTRRIEESGASSGLELEGKRVTTALKSLESQEGRLTDAYLSEAMDLGLYKTKMDQLAGQRHDLERLSREITDQNRWEANNRHSLDRLNEFCYGVRAGLENMSFEERQRFVRLMIEAIVVEDGCIKLDSLVTRPV